VTRAGHVRLGADEPDRRRDHPGRDRDADESGDGGDHVGDPAGVLAERAVVGQGVDLQQ
jgi:hypothetical protein